MAGIMGDIKKFPRLTWVLTLNAKLSYNLNYIRPKVIDKSGTDELNDKQGGNKKQSQNSCVTTQSSHREVPWFKTPPHS